MSGYQSPTTGGTTGRYHAEGYASPPSTHFVMLGIMLQARRTRVVDKHICNENPAEAKRPQMYSPTIKEQ